LKLEDIRLVHALPGRIRFKLESIKGNPEQARDIEARLATVRGMHHVEAKSLTGSVVATFDPALLESLDFHFAVANALGIPASDLNPEYLAKWYANESNGTPMLPPNIGENWRLLVPFALLALGVRGVLAAERLIFPQWYDYLWFAFGTYYTLNPPAASQPRPSERT
jgi:Heavy metal associated domain 2